MRLFTFASVLTFFCTPALAGDLVIEDAFARAASPNAKSGAAFLTIVNQSDEDDRLVEARSDIAARVELHTHLMEDGIMRMRHVEDGFDIPAGETYALERGGDHVMFMGLTRPMLDGETVEVILVFEKAGEVTAEIPVDLDR